MIEDVQARAPRKGWVGVGALCAALSAFIAAPSALAAGGPQLAGLWLLNEGAGQSVADSSGNGLNGVLGSTTGVDSSDPTWIPGPWRGTKALRFDGGEYVTIPDSPLLESDKITVGAIVRATGSPGSYRYIASKGAFQCEVASYGLYTGASGGLMFYVSNGTTNYTLSADAGSRVWDGRWHLVIGWYDGATIRLFVDGAEVGTGVATTVQLSYGLPDDDRFYIGDYRGPCPSSLGFVGDIDAVGVVRDLVRTIRTS